MSRENQPRAVLASLILALAAAGCGGDGNAAAVAAAEVRPVQDVGELYRMYLIDHKKPPRSPADFRPLQEANPEAFRAVSSGDVVVIWGVTLTGLDSERGQDSPDEVLAYEKKVPDQGGTVLMKDRSIRRMTADEFKAAPRAVGH